MLPPPLLTMPPPLMMRLAHLSAHLLPLPADEDGAGRLRWVHPDVRGEARHHTYPRRPRLRVWVP